MPTGKHIYIRNLHNNIIGSLSIPQYVHFHQGNTPVVRTKYIEVQDLDLVFYRSLYMVIKVGTKWIPIVARIIPGISIPLLIGMNYKDTQRKVNALKTKKIFFFQDNKSTTTSLTVKRLACMHMDMEHCDHSKMTTECKRLGCTKKSIEDRISKVIQECITCRHKGSTFTQGKITVQHRCT